MLSLNFICFTTIVKEVTLTYTKPLSLARCCARVWSCVVGETGVPGENPLVRLGDHQPNSHAPRPRFEPGLPW